jgi:hypothetical protein
MVRGFLGFSPAADLKNGQSNQKINFGFMELLKKRTPACHAKCVGLAQSLVMNQMLNVDTHPFRGIAGRSNIESSRDKADKCPRKVF